MFFDIHVSFKAIVSLRELSRLQRGAACRMGLGYEALPLTGRGKYLSASAGFLIYKMEAGMVPTSKDYQRNN